MKYLPYENLTYRTPLTPEEILKRIDDVIEPKKMFRMKGGFWGNSDHKPYEGSIKDLSFKMTRIISYRNSFLPVIKGKIGRDINGTKVEVSMRLNSFVLVFMAIWMAGVGLACVVMLPLFTFEGTFDYLNLIPYGMLLFGHVLVTGGFKYESTRSKKDLATFLKATIE
ncbi:MAG: hypothetical protein AAGI38_17255 [Bacteroidota bacterium]